jgi:GNAT superfamily N-acetyltransferase
MLEISTRVADDSISLRQASILRGDATVISRIVHEAFSELALEGTVYSSPQVKRWILNKLLRNRVNWFHFEREYFYIAEYMSELAGFAHFIINQRVAHLNWMAVVPRFQHKKILTKMFELFRAAAASRGCHVLTVDVVKEDLRLRNWYKRQGFVETGETYLYRVAALPRKDEISAEDMKDLCDAFRRVTKSVWCRLFGFGKSSLKISGRSVMIGILNENAQVLTPLTSAVQFETIAQSMREALGDRFSTVFLRSTIPIPGYTPRQVRIRMTANSIVTGATLERRR